MLTVAFFMLLAFFGSDQRASGPANGSRADAAVHNFLLGAFPELRAGGTQARYERSEDGLTVFIEPAPADALDHNAGTEKPFLTARLTFDTGGLLVTYRAEGPWARTGENAALRARLARPGARLEEELGASGARYGALSLPDVLRAMPLAGVQQLLGRIGISNASFHASIPRDSEAEAVACGWIVVLQLSQPGGDRTYEAILEPFDARLVELRLVGGAR